MFEVATESGWKCEVFIIFPLYSAACEQERREGEREGGGEGDNNGTMGCGCHGVDREGVSERANL